MSPNNMSGSGRTTTTATTTSPARVRRGRSADRSEDRSLRRLSSACGPSCFSPRHGRSSALPRAHDGSRRGGVSGGGGGDSGHERSRTNRQDARSSGRERGGGIGGGDVGRVGGSRDARSSSYGAAKRGRSEDRRDAGSVRDRRPRSREDVRSSGRGTRTKRGRSEDRGDAGTARERRPRSREGARWSSRDRNIGGRCRDRADGRSSAGGGLERRRTSAVAGSRGGDGDDNRRERPSSRGAGDASFAGRRRTDGGEGEGKRSGALGGDSKRHRSGSRDNGRRTAAIRSPSSRDDDGRERNTAFSRRRDDDDDVRVNRRYPRDGAAASRNPRPRDQAAASSPPPLRISTTGQPSRGNGNGDRTPMTPTEKWKAPLSSSPRERRAAHTPSHRSSLSTRRDGRSTRPPSSSSSSPLVGQEAGGGTGKEKAEEAEVDGMELPRHLLGQKPDFEAEGGGRGEELKFADNIEVDPHRLATRQKQIDFGMNTLGYETYLEKVPRNKRRKTDPATPDKTQKMSKRRWAGKIRSWRRQLHQYDASTTNTSASGDGTPPTRTARDATEAADEEGDFKESGEIGLWSSCSSSDDDSGANGGNGNNNGSPTFDLDAAAAAEASWSPTAATMAAAAATPALVVNVGEGGEDPRYAGAAEPGSKDSHPSTRGTSLTSGESAFSLTAGRPHATHQQPQQQQQQQQHINAGIYADDDDGFGESRSGGGGGVSDDLTASSPFEGGEDGVGGARKRRRGDRASSSTAGTAAPSPWGNSVEYWCGESGSEDEDEDEDGDSDGEDDGEGTGRRRRKRRRRWGGNRTSKLGGGEQLRPGELLADEEEELEGKRLNEVDGNGVAAEVEVKGDGEEGSFGAGVKEELAERGVDGVHVDGGAGGARFVREESRQMVVEGAGLQDQVKAEMEATGVGVKQELELDEDAFSDDELL